MAEDLHVDKLVKVYIKIRDKREKLAREYEQEDGELKLQQDTIKSAMLEAFKAVGADSLKTAFGTATRVVKTRYWPSDWGAMHEFCKTHNALDLLERRISQNNMKTFLQEHPDVRVPGLNSDSAYDVSIRRK